MIYLGVKCYSINKKNRKYYFNVTEVLKRDFLDINKSSSYTENLSFVSSDFLISSIYLMKQLSNAKQLLTLKQYLTFTCK
jgi:hypothetical protein